MIGEASAVLDDLRFQAETIHVHYGSKEVGQSVGVVFVTGEIGVQVYIRAPLGIPGDHIEVEHAEEVLAGIGHVAGVVVTAIVALLLAGEEDDAGGVGKVEVRQQVGRDEQCCGTTRVVVGAGSWVVRPDRRPGV